MTRPRRDDRPPVERATRRAIVYLTRAQQVYSHFRSLLSNNCLAIKLTLSFRFQLEIGMREVGAGEDGDATALRYGTFNFLF